MVAAGIAVDGQRTALRDISEVSWPGIPQSAACARRHLRAVLEGHPSLETALLLVSELVTNAVRHSSSSDVGGRITVTVSERESVIRLEVIDDGPLDGMPHLVDAAPDAENGRGLWIVKELAPYGVEIRDGRKVVWFELEPCPDWCSEHVADCSCVRRLADELRQVGVEPTYTGRNLLTLSRGKRRAFVTLRPGDPQTWQWLEQGRPARPLCPADDVARAAACVTRALATARWE